MTKNVQVYKKSTSPFGHGEPSVEEFVGEMSLSEAEQLLEQEHDNYDYTFSIKDKSNSAMVKTEKEFLSEFGFSREPKYPPIGPSSSIGLPSRVTTPEYKFDALVCIMRAQPFHNGHKAVIDIALQQAKEVVIVVGSSFQSRSIRNPFTFEERKAMIKACYPQDNVKVVPVSDYPYDDNKWINAIQKVVDEAVPNAKEVGLIGHSKDSTSYYLNIFPRWKNHVEVPNVDGINATDIRKMMFETERVALNKNTQIQLQHLLPKSAHKVMVNAIIHGKTLENGWKNHWNVLCEEYEMVKKYKEAWKAAPFPPTFVTVDAVVVQSGHILLVKRGDMPGKGLWALPGGFLNQEETMLDGAIRELKEETKIKVPVPVLKGSIKDSKTFDAPNRSARGRTITQAFFIDLGVGELPRVKGSDDAELAKWIPFNELKQEIFFEDHAHICSHFLGINWD